MDFNDSPEEAAYRAKASTWLDANATLHEWRFFSLDQRALIIGRETAAGR